MVLKWGLQHFSTCLYGPQRGALSVREWAREEGAGWFRGHTLGGEVAGCSKKSDLAPVTSAPRVYKMGMIIRAAPPVLRIKEQYTPGSL